MILRRVGLDVGVNGSNMAGHLWFLVLERGTFERPVSLLVPIRTGGSMSRMCLFLEFTEPTQINPTGCQGGDLSDPTRSATLVTRPLKSPGGVDTSPERLTNKQTNNVLLRAQHPSPTCYHNVGMNVARPVHTFVCLVLTYKTTE